MKEPKKVLVDVDFIKEAHNSACQAWQERIEDRIPEAFLPEGDWMINIEHNDCIVYVPRDRRANKDSLKVTDAIHCSGEVANYYAYGATHSEGYVKASNEYIGEMFRKAYKLGYIDLSK